MAEDEAKREITETEEPDERPADQMAAGYEDLEPSEEDQALIKGGSGRH